VDVTVEATAALLARWAPLAEGHQPIDLGAALRDLSQEIIRRILFGPTAGPDA
jgi:hypothetical protein